MLFEKIELEEDENVILTVRKHWFVITAELITALMFAFLPFLILIFLSALPEFVPLNIDFGTYSSLIVYASAAWILLTLLSQTASAAESNFMTVGLPDPRGIQSVIQKATDERLRSLQGTLQTEPD